jgi:hypothetical protein
MHHKLKGIKIPIFCPKFRGPSDKFRIDASGSEAHGNTTTTAAVQSAALIQKKDRQG